MTLSPRTRALAETAATYGAGAGAPGHQKFSITLPADLADQVRAAAESSGTSVSGVIAAAVRSATDHAERDRLDAAIAAQNEENLVWAGAFGPTTSRLWSELEW